MLLLLLMLTTTPTITHIAFAAQAASHPECCCFCHWSHKSRASPAPSTLITSYHGHLVEAPIRCPCQIPLQERTTFKVAVMMYCNCLRDLARLIWRNTVYRRHPIRVMIWCMSSSPSICNRGSALSSIHGPAVWNRPPHELRSTDISVDTLRKRLKALSFDTGA